MALAVNDAQAGLKKVTIAEAPTRPDGGPDVSSPSAVADRGTGKVTVRSSGGVEEDEEALALAAERRESSKQV